jgi:hypothetical protein
MGGKLAKEEPVVKGESTIKLLGTQDDSKKMVAVIVTFCNCNSYDNLFSTVQQKTIEGTKVEVYSCSAFYIDDLIEAFKGNPKDDTAIRLMKSIGEVDPDCVVFNW